MIWFARIMIIILLLLMALLAFTRYMNSLPIEKQNEIFDKIDNWIANFWK